MGTESVAEATRPEEAGGVTEGRLARFAPTRALTQGATGAALYTREGALIGGSDVAQSPRDSARRRILAVADVAGIALAYLAVWTVQPPAGTFVDRLPLVGALVLWVVLNKLLGLYDRDDKLIHKSTFDELPKILHSLVLGSLTVYMVGPLVLPVDTGREQALLFIVFGAFTVPLLRAAGRGFVTARFAPERCMIVGSGSVAKVMARKLTAHPEYGVEVVGFVDDDARERSAQRSGLPFLGDVRDFAELLRRHEIERVVIAFSTAVSNDKLLDLIRTAKREQIKITVVPRLHEVIGHSVEVDEVEGMTVLSLKGLSRARSSLLLKRAIDLAVASIGLLLLAPMLTAIAVAIKLSSRGPVFYVQRRMGRDREFAMIKFRTMVQNADDLKPQLAHLNEATGPMFKITRDPRVTRIGRFLRRTSLDELPQLWNVVRGEMSLVGPRPLIPDEDDHCIGWHRTRLELTPGLTGPWQVAGRTAIPFHEMVKMDYLYVAEWSLWNDIRLLLRTIPVVFLARGS